MDSSISISKIKLLSKVINIILFTKFDKIITKRYAKKSCRKIKKSYHSQAFAVR